MPPVAPLPSIRQVAERVLKRVWFGDDALARIGAALAAPLSALTARVSAQRRSRIEWLAPPPVPVVVVGNLVAGGAGKTPLVIAIARALLQQPLIQDGALNDKGKRAGVNVRLLCLGRAPGETPREFIYRLETPKLGLCELLALDEHRFLTIERDGSERRFRRVYLIDTEGATDIAAMKSLPADTLPDGVKPVSKRAIIDLADPSIGLRDMPEKIEGLCMGPTLSDGRRTLVVASDNDMKADEPTWFWVFALPADLLPAAKTTQGADASTTKPSQSPTR